VLPATLDEAAQARYLRYQPQAADYLALGDFRFFRMEPARARFIGGFGRMGWVDACPPPAQLDSRTEARLLDALGTLAPAGVSVLGLDFEGLDVRICGVSRRLAPCRRRRMPRACLRLLPTACVGRRLSRPIQA
jgi:hypothetical protein